jgi:hypothetical protein
MIEGFLPGTLGYGLTFVYIPLREERYPIVGIDERNFVLDEDDFRAPAKSTLRRGSRREFSLSGLEDPELVNPKLILVSLGYYDPDDSRSCVRRRKR